MGVESDRFGGMKSLLSFFVAGIVSLSTYAGQTVDYKVDGKTYKGYLATPKKLQETTPGVLVVHEWWGLNDYARKRADMLADLGYIAFAVDMYGNGKTADHPKDAGAFSGQVKSNMAAAEKRFKAAMDILKKQKNVNKEKIAAIGYCFGGGVVLEMARRGVDLDAVVSFHGSLTTDNPAKKGEIKADVAVFTGAADPMVPEESVKNFEKEMKAAGVDYKLVNYPGVVHAFTNPTATKLGKKFEIPIAYDEKADKDSWRQMKDFLKKAFSS